MNHSNTHPPTQPRNGKSHKVSERGLLSVAMLLVSVGALGIAGLGGSKMVLDVLSSGTPNPANTTGSASAVAQAIVVALAYFVGWFTAMVTIRVYGNLIMPILITWFTWGCLAGVCFLYIEILQRMYQQPDELGRFFKYLIVMAGGLAGLVGLHLIIEDHNLRPFSIPLLIICLFQLGLIVVRYVFDTEGVNPGFLWKDLFFFFAMVAVSVAMLAHWGILDPLRKRITNYFDRNSVSIRSDD